MLDETKLTELPGRRLVDRDGQDLGTVDDVFSHTAMDQAAWAVVVLDGARRLVPLHGATEDGEALRVDVARDVVASAPVAEGDAVRPDAGLYAHFGLSDAEVRDDTGFPAGYGNAGATPGDPRTDRAADDAAQGHP
jgi:sporulation protein YlmC with PRC-barrel domain